MNTYYDYLRDRVLAAAVRDRTQLEHLVHLERNALWQTIVSNPAYDERGRMAALAAFDEAAAYVLSEEGARMERMAAAPGPEPGRARHAPAAEPLPRSRPVVRDLLFFLLGMAVGVLAAYLLGGTAGRELSSSRPASPLGIEGLAASEKAFKFIRSRPSPLEGEITVTYASGAPSDTYVCEVEATYRQLLEYARFDKACRTVAFKFLPLEELWANFNNLEGYMVFSATIMSPEGGKWQGSTSVYFSIDGTT